MDNNTTDYGRQPVVINIAAYAMQNTAFRKVVWTGEYMQITVMSIEPGSEIGAELHDELDQFLCIVHGTGRAMMGETEDNLDFIIDVKRNAAIVVPAGTWHNLKNTGDMPLKLYSIYAPPTHPFGTIHETKEDAEKSEY